MINRYIVSQLLEHMRACNRRGISFADCLAEARKEFNRELKQRADATPLTK